MEGLTWWLSHGDKDGDMACDVVSDVATDVALIRSFFKWRRGTIRYWHMTPLDVDTWHHLMLTCGTTWWWHVASPYNDAWHHHMKTCGTQSVWQVVVFLCVSKCHLCVSKCQLCVGKCDLCVGKNIFIIYLLFLFKKWHKNIIIIKFF